jgi:hypothetical protein
MRALVVYESMYGNTHLVANAIGEGLAAHMEVDVVPVEQASDALVRGADLVVVGGPTHVHGMTRDSTRKAAVEAARKPDANLELDPDAAGPGLRDWFDGLAPAAGRAAAFDTRMDGPAALTGRASKGIRSRLRRHGFDVIADPRSFLVDKQNHLEPHQADAARAWGEQLAGTLVVVP